MLKPASTAHSTNGHGIAEQAIELFTDLPPDLVLQQLAFMSAEEIPAYETLLQRLKNRPTRRLLKTTRHDRHFGLCYIEPRHRFGLLSDELMSKIVAAHNQFYENLPAELRNAIERYDPAKYIAAATVMDNVLFGRVGNNHPSARIIYAPSSMTFLTSWGSMPSFWMSAWTSTSAPPAFG